MVPQTWFNYGNAGGGVDIVGVADQRSRSGQTGDNRLLAWGFDANSDPGYGGIGKEYPSPQNWSQYSGVKFWFYGSGEGGQLQIEIGEDKTTDVERYRAPTFVDNQLGWRLVRLDFDSFTPASWNPVPGNEVLDLLSVENIVFAANSGITSSGVAIDDVTLYSDGSDLLHRLHRPHQPQFLSLIRRRRPVWSGATSSTEAALIPRIGDMTLVAGAGVMVSPVLHRQARKRSCF